MHALAAESVNPTLADGEADLDREGRLSGCEAERSPEGSVGLECSSNRLRVGEVTQRLSRSEAELDAGVKQQKGTRHRLERRRAGRYD